MSIQETPQSTIQQQDFQEYIKILNGSKYTPIFKLNFLNEDETIIYEATLDIFDANGNYQNTFNQFGIRRSFNLTLDNIKGKYNINKNNLFIGQKVELFAGYKVEDKEYLFPQGIFYLTNPTQSITPIIDTITLECADKWYGLSTLYGNLDSIYHIPVIFEDKTKAITSPDRIKLMNYNIYELMTSILQLPQRSNIRIIANMPQISTTNYKNAINTYLFGNDTISLNLLLIKEDEAVKDISNNNIYRCKGSRTTDLLNTEWELYTDIIQPLDPKQPLLDPYFEQTTDDLNMRLILPYSIKKTRQDTYESIFSEFAKMLPCNMYYNVNGRLTNEATNEDIDDFRKEIVFDFDELSPNLYNINSSFDTNKIFNDVTVVATIQNVGTYEHRVVNDDPRLITNITNIPNKSWTEEGLPTYSVLMFYPQMKEKYPTETEEQLTQRSIDKVQQCIREYAVWLLRQKSTVVESYTITCVPMYHLDVNKLIYATLSDGERSLFLIKSYSYPLNSSGVMTINVEKVFDFRFVFTDK